MRYLLALDQGTTSSRSILFEPDGSVVASSKREFRQIFPRPGLVEHDPEEIWSSQIETVREALAEARASARDIAAIGITNQRETTIVWDRKTGAPVHNAIVWQDRRTADVCGQLRDEGREADVQTRTGLLLDPYFSATKLRWILDHVASARDRAERGELAFGTVDSWLVWKLTGGQAHATDPSNASRTLLFDLRRGEFDDELLSLFRIPRPVLPEIVDSIGTFAEAAIDPLKGVPIAGVLGDQQAALFGQGCDREGLAKNTYGTGCFLLANTGGNPVSSRNRLLATVAWRRGDKTTFALEGSVFAGGSVVQWLRDGLGIIERAADVEALAASVEDSGGVVLVPAFSGLGAPHWDADARGALFGLTRGTTRAHIARAALEGIALQVADLVTAIEGDRGRALSELRVDGGAAVNDLLMQIQADLLGIPVVRPDELEATAFGAARAAGLGAGILSDGDSAARRGAARRFEPRAGAPAHLLRERWADAVSRILTERERR